MKKFYQSPEAKVVTIAVEGMLAGSQINEMHDEVSNNVQLSNGSAWSSDLWASEEDE